MLYRDTQSASWSCSVCYFDNRARSKQCDLCGTSKEVCTACTASLHAITPIATTQGIAAFSLAHCNTAIIEHQRLQQIVCISASCNLQLLVLDKSRYKSEVTTAAAGANNGDSNSIHSSGSSSSSPDADSTYGQAARSAVYSTDDTEAGTDAAASANSSSGRNSSSSAIARDEAVLLEEKNRASSRAVGIVRLMRLTQVCLNCRCLHFCYLKCLQFCSCCCLRRC
jgi:hypothetical protein